MFTLVHTSDWHIGKAFAAFENDVPSLLRQARIDAIDRIAAIARAEGAGHVLVAGDTFDAPTLTDATLRNVLSRLARHADMTWHLIPGNHDPDTAGGIFDRLGRLGSPTNVRLHRSAEPVEIAARIALLPAPLRAKASAVDPTRWMDEAATPEGTLRIGLAHGATTDFSILSSRAAATAEPVSPTRARSAGLAYLALGDWHGRKQIARETWYCGTHEPDAFSDTERGSVLVVRFEGDRLASVEPRVSAGYRWRELTIVASCADDLAPLDDALAGIRSTTIPHLLRVVLSGRCSLDDMAAIERRLTEAAGHVVALETDLAALLPVTVSTVGGAFADHRLQLIAARLAEAASSSVSSATSKVAADALRLLHRLASTETERAS